MEPPGRKHPADKGMVPLHVTSTGATMVVRLLSLLLGAADVYCAIVMTVLLVSASTSISKESMLVLSALGELD
jgi:hypothetical protein